MGRDGVPRSEAEGRVSEDLQIRLLRDSPAFLETITHWVSEEWEKTTEEALGVRMLGNDGCPATLVAVSGDEVVGVIAFTRVGTDGQALEGLWVNILYVEETMRAKGIGKRLLAEGVEAARESGEERLFALTEVAAYYEALGWERGRDRRGDSKVVTLDL